MSLTFKRNEVVTGHKTRGGINVFNKKSLCTAHHQNYLNNMCLCSCSRHKVHANAKFVNAYVVFKNECDAIKALNE